MILALNLQGVQFFWIKGWSFPSKAFHLFLIIRSAASKVPADVEVTAGVIFKAGRSRGLLKLWGRLLGFESPLLFDAIKRQRIRCA